MRLPTRHLWELSPASLYADAGYRRAWHEAGDLSAATSLSDDSGNFQWQQLTAKGTLGGQLYGPSSQLGKLAATGGCGGTDLDALRACQEQQGMSAATAMGTFVGVIGTAIGGPLVGAGLTALWGSLVKAVGIAQAGYGTCDDRTPANQSYVVDPSTDWTTWPYQFYQGNGRTGFYPKPIQEPAPGTFEAYADGLIQADFANLHNCAPPCPNHACGQVAPALGPVGALAQAIAAWNATHSASSTRTVTRYHLQAKQPNGWVFYDFADGFGDSIGDALYETGALIERGGGTAPNTMSFTINDGPALALSKSAFGFAATQAGPPAPRLSPAMVQRAAPMSTTTKVLLVGGGGLLAVALFKPALLRGIPGLRRFARR